MLQTVGFELEPERSWDMSSRAMLGLFVLFAIIALGACSQPTQEQQILEDVSAALGGRELIEAVTTLSIEGEGVMGNLGQDMTPDATSQTFAISDYIRVANLTTGRMRVERTRTPDFNYFRARTRSSRSSASTATSRTLLRRTAVRRAQPTPRRAPAARRTTTTRSRSFVPLGTRARRQPTPGPRTARVSWTSPPMTASRSRWRSTPPPSYRVT